MKTTAPLSILIVEDERIVAKDLQAELNELGYDAYAIAASAESALARVAERCPDVVLMDIRIQGDRDGVETAEILKRRFDVPIVYLTAHADDATLARATQTGPHGYLLKPVKAGELRAAIEVSVYRHRMDRRLRERERWFSTTLSSIADAVITVDLAGNVTFMNAAAELLTGVSASDAIGKPSRTVLQLVGDAAPDPLALALRDKQRIELFEANLRDVSTGALRTINDSAAPVVDENGLLGAVMVFRDVTERNRMQRQLDIADRLKSLGTMAAGVAHEINNPLAVVVANAAFVRAQLTRLVDELRQIGHEGEASIACANESIEAVSESLVAANRVGRIVADLRTFSRPEQTVSAFADVTRSVEWAIRATASELRHCARVIYQPGDACFVSIDEGRLGQVLVNLLLNAAHAIPHGAVSHNSVTLDAKRVADGRVVIEVADTGAGMSEEVQKRVFEPFFTSKPVGQGTGLGLSICHGIINAAGGSLEVESTVGRGTTVRITLAQASPAVALLDAIAPPVASERRGRVMVIDDEEMVMRAIRRTLKKHDPVCFTSAQQALEALRADSSFDVVLCDLMMPDLTGLELYEALLKQAPELAQRIMFLTGGAVSARFADFLASVPNPRMQKPFDAGALQQQVDDLIGASQARTFGR